MSATPANSQASLEAKRNNKPYGRLITTTPGDLQTEQGTWCKQFINNCCVFKDEMYDWEDEEVEEYILNNSANNFIFIQFMYYQIGRSEAWYKHQCRELGNDRFKIKREILLDWTKSSDMAIFGEYEIDRLYENVKNSTCSIPLKKVYRLELLKDFDFRKTLMIGVDTATGLSQDFSAITVCDPNNRLEVLATFRNNTIDTIEFAQVIYELASMYITNGPIIIERNSVGQTIIDYLLKTNIANRIYYEFKEQKAEKKLTDGTVRRSKTKTKVYGISTNNDTRPKMIDLLRTAVNESYDVINSKVLVEEIAGLERQRNGKIEHSQTSHDDLLFSYLMCQYAWAYGEKLQEFGIYKRLNSFESQSVMSSGVMTAQDAAIDFARRFHSISKYNQDYDKYSTGISAHNIINQFMEEEYRLSQFYEEETSMNKNNILNSLLDIYEN